MVLREFAILLNQAWCAALKMMKGCTFPSECGVREEHRSVGTSTKIMAVYQGDDGWRWRVRSA
jgi:hypothetical protein